MTTDLDHEQATTTPTVHRLGGRIGARADDLSREHHPLDLAGG
jgi:hypothetical protein